MAEESILQLSSTLLLLSLILFGIGLCLDGSVVSALIAGSAGTSLVLALAAPCCFDSCGLFSRGLSATDNVCSVPPVLFCTTCLGILDELGMIRALLTNCV